jgi:hypothetical protein
MAATASQFFSLLWRWMPSLHVLHTNAAALIEELCLDRAWQCNAPCGEHSNWQHFCFVYCKYSIYTWPSFMCPALPH